MSTRGVFTVPGRSGTPLRLRILLRDTVDYVQEGCVAVVDRVGFEFQPNDLGKFRGLPPYSFLICFFSHKTCVSRLSIKDYMVSRMFTYSFSNCRGILLPLSDF